jgi:hypothetical protein
LFKSNALLPSRTRLGFGIQGRLSPIVILYLPSSLRGQFLKVALCEQYELAITDFEGL